MTTYEERLSALESDVKEMKDVITIKLDDTNHHLTMVKGIAIGQEQDVKAIKTQLSIINSRLDVVDSRLNRVDVRLDGMDAHLEMMDKRLDGMDARIAAMDKRLDGMNTHIAAMDTRLATLEKQQEEQGNDIKEIKQGLAAILSLLKDGFRGN